MLKKEELRLSLLAIHNKIIEYDQALEIGKDALGAKAFNLASCHGAGFHVPKGIIVPLQSFFAYQRGEDLTSLFETIRRRFEKNCRLIVRSSALQEDLINASFAGQYISVVCQNNIYELKNSCEACWQSYFSGNISTYSEATQSNNVDNEGMALIIQQLLNTTSAGVCFTNDPQRKKEDKIIINAVHGLGEALVSSEVISDHYEFDRATETVEYKTTMQQMFYLSPLKPEKLELLPDEMTKKAVLSQTQIKEVAEMALSVHRFFNTPIDIEWAYEYNTLFLLQARPITRTACRDAYEIWTRDNVADVIPDAVTPLTWSIVKDATNNGFLRSIERLGFPPDDTNLFELFDGRIYFNQSSYQRLLSPRKKMKHWYLLKIACSYFKTLLTFRNKCARYDKNFQDGLDNIVSSDCEDSISELKKYFEEYMLIHIHNTIMLELGFAITRKIVSRFIAEDNINAMIDGLVTGLESIESTTYADALWQLARQISQEPGLTQKVIKASVQSVPTILINHGGYIKDGWQAFLKKYGYTSLKEFELSSPRWFEKPDFIIGILQHYLQEGEVLDENANRKVNSKIKTKAETAILQQASFYYYPVLKFYIRHIQECSIRRESFKQKIVKIVSIIRRQALILAEKYQFKPLDTIFFLTIDELDQIHNYSFNEEWKKEISKRITNWTASVKSKPFAEIRVHPDGQISKIPHVEKNGSQLEGLALSYGHYTGTAKVITDPDQIDSFNNGDILVARSTNPSWTPLFILSGAIVTDMGNYLSHGAIVARELGIPAVGNVYDATLRIKTGQILFVNGDTGMVTILDE